MPSGEEASKRICETRCTVVLSKAHMTACAGDCIMMWLCKTLQVAQSRYSCDAALIPSQIALMFIAIEGHGLRHDHRSGAGHVMWQHLP